MLDPFAVLTPLFAQAAEGAAAPAPAPTPAPGAWDTLFIVLPILLILYWFFMLRPQQKQDEKHRKMMDSLDRNDRVYTVGGVIGTIHAIDKEKNEVVLKVDDSNGTKVRFLLSAVVAPIPKETDKTD